jgi:Transposase zinc-binding domain/Transposase domain (DUF772)
LASLRIPLALVPHVLGETSATLRLKERLSFMPFLGRALQDPIPDTKALWLFREQLTNAGALQRLFQRFDAVLRPAGCVAMGGQIVDPTVIPACRPRLTRDEKTTIKGGGVPEGWSRAKRAQMDTDGRWTLIVSCRTTALGGHVASCEACDHSQIAYNSGRNRHCQVSGRPQQRRGWPSEAPISCPRPTSTSSSPCRPRSPISPPRTRR